MNQEILHQEIKYVENEIQTLEYTLYKLKEQIIYNCGIIYFSNEEYNICLFDSIFFNRKQIRSEKYFLPKYRNYKYYDECKKRNEFKLKTDKIILETKIECLRTCEEVFKSVDVIHILYSDEKYNLYDLLSENLKSKNIFSEVAKHKHHSYKFCSPW
jgi:hypothetical protein